MCSIELECLQLINENIIDIKAFCYALAVSLAIALVVFVAMKLITATVGQVF